VLDRAWDPGSSLVGRCLERTDSRFVNRATRVRIGVPAVALSGRLTGDSVSLPCGGLLVGRVGTSADEGNRGPNNEHDEESFHSRNLPGRNLPR
jgi:hypothetical protein